MESSHNELLSNVCVNTNNEGYHHDKTINHIGKMEKKSGRLFL